MLQGVTSEPSYKALLHNNQNEGKEARKYPFMCEHCCKTYCNKTDLARHINSHAEERPFECEMCNKRFSQKRYLTGHRRIYAGERPYT